MRIHRASALLSADIFSPPAMFRVPSDAFPLMSPALDRPPKALIGFELGDPPPPTLANWPLAGCCGCCGCCGWAGCAGCVCPGFGAGCVMPIGGMILLTVGGVRRRPTFVGIRCASRACCCACSSSISCINTGDNTTASFLNSELAVT